VKGRADYHDLISDFLNKTEDEILGQLLRNSGFDVKETQQRAWSEQIRILKYALQNKQPQGKLYFEFSVPRVGKRIDCVLAINNTLFVIEFKVGESTFESYAIDQVWDYAVDLKNFHESSHHQTIVPILVATNAANRPFLLATSIQDDGVYQPILISGKQLADVIHHALSYVDADPIDIPSWERGGYRPTPTIIEAAIALYSGHGVQDISRSDAAAINLTQTSAAIEKVIAEARKHKQKAICFVTGVPGAGKTLVGLNISTLHKEGDRDLNAVFLSGNGPLVAILQEALARDRVQREKASERRLTKGDARRAVKSFIQNVHHYRDECLRDTDHPPAEHIAIFDEAQRAWDLAQTASFMHRKKGVPDFNRSESAFLISCLDRHQDWAVIVCLVGGGQEINTGEAGIEAWVNALDTEFPEWHVHISGRLHDEEYGAGRALKTLERRQRVTINDNLHLGISMRSFRAENVSSWVKHMLDLKRDLARPLLQEISNRYPIVMTRSISHAKAWLKDHARGSERFGIVVSSQALRLKPHAIDVRVMTDPVHWFLDGKDDVRSSFYLEDVATEFQVQGLELDWACVVWDADFRFNETRWTHHSFVGSRWQHIRKEERQTYLKNAYRVLLTRARQGMVIVVPEGDAEDQTRLPEFYDTTYRYLRDLGIPEIPSQSEMTSPT
jgi:DUF2075 family protein